MWKSVSTYLPTDGCCAPKDACFDMVAEQAEMTGVQQGHGAMAKPAQDIEDRQISTFNATPTGLQSRRR